MKIEDDAPLADATAQRSLGAAKRSDIHCKRADAHSDGQGFKFTAEQVALLLQKGMRDVTPRG